MEETLKIENTSEEPKEKKIQDNLKPLRTYQGDVEKVIEGGKVSVATVAIAEQKRRIDEGTDNTPPENSNVKNKIFIYLGMFLFIVGVLSIGVVYFIKSNTGSTDQTQVKPTIISHTDEKIINFSGETKDTLISKIVKEKTDFNKQINSVLYLNFSDNGETINIQNLLPRISTYAPQTLIRSLGDDYMFGIYSYDKNEPFIILTTKDYGASFAGMLKWETNMIYDIGGIFEIQKNSDGTPMFFEDEAVQNKDMRAVKDENKKTILVYSFIDNNTIVITKNEQVLIAIFGKYINSKMVR